MLYRLAHKNVSKFAMMLYCSTVEFTQREMTRLKSNHSWTIWEIMTLYAFVLTVKYAKECWVSEKYKITNNFNTSHCMRSISIQRLAENVLNRASILLINHIQSFFHCTMDFRTVSMVTSFHLKGTNEKWTVTPKNSDKKLPKMWT